MGIKYVYLDVVFFFQNPGFLEDKNKKIENIRYKNLFGA